MLYACCPRPVREDIISYREWLTGEHDAISLDSESATGWSYRLDGNGDPIQITCKPATVAAYLGSVKMFFMWTASEGLYPNVAVAVRTPTIKKDSHKKDFLTPDQVQEVEASMEARAAAKREAAGEAVRDAAGMAQRADEQSKRLRALFLLATNAGMRTIELSRARVGDFETRGQQASLRIWGKGHTEADAKKILAPEVALAVREYLDARTDSYTTKSPLFVSTGNRSGGKAIAPTTISTMLKGAMKEAGYNSPKLTAHSLRHTCGMGAMKASGGNLYDTQRYMRHASPVTTEVYLHDDQNEDSGLAERLWDHLHGGKEAESDREKMENVMDKMTPAQLAQLAAIAQAMA